MLASAALAYDILIGLHVAAVVLGFGAVAVSGAYGAIGRRLGEPGARPDTVEEVRRYFAKPSRVVYLVLVGPALGVAALAVRPGGTELGQVWAVAGMVIWLVAGGLLTAVVRPAEARIRAAAGDGPAVAGPARRLMWAATGSDVLFVVALFLMVTQPR